MGKLTSSRLTTPEISIFDIATNEVGDSEQMLKRATGVDDSIETAMSALQAAYEGAKTDQPSQEIQEDGMRSEIDAQRAEAIETTFPPEGSEYQQYSEQELEDTRRQEANMERFGTLINQGDEDAAFALIGKEDTAEERNAFQGYTPEYKRYSNIVGQEADKLNFNWSSAKKAEFDLKSKEDIPLGDVASMAEYGKRFLNLSEEAGREGLSQAFTDSVMLPFLHVLREQVWKREDRLRRVEAGLPEFENVDDEKAGTVSLNSRIGGLVESALNIKNGTDSTKAVTGVLAKELMVKMNDQLVKAGETPILEAKTVKVSDEQSLRTIELTPKGLDLADRLKDLTSSLIPDSRVAVRFNPLPEVADLRRETFEKKRKTTKGLDYGTFVMMQKFITKHQNVWFKSNKSLHDLIGASSQNPEAKAILDGPGYTNLKGVELRDGTVAKRDVDGRPLPYANVLNGQGERIPNDITDPNNPLSVYKYKIEQSLSDRSKDMQNDQTTEWINDTEGKAFQYDLYISQINRVYLKQSIGNWQTNKFTRSLMQTGKPYSFSLSNRDAVNNHKSLVIMKAGLHKSEDGRTLSEAERVSLFDAKVKSWESAFNESQVAGVPGIPVSILQEGAHEGWEFLTAVEEALKLNQFEKNPLSNKPYTTSFFAEIDGKNNGLAHNSVQSGDPLAARLTGVLPALDGDPADAYYYVVNTFNEMFNQHVQNFKGDEAQRVKFKAIWEATGKADRSLGKGPLMVFVYGAEPKTIMSRFSESMDKLLKHPDVAATVVENNLTTKDLNNFRDRSAQIMAKSINTDFGRVRQLARATSALTDYAIEKGLDPVYTDTAGMVTRFGKSSREVDPKRGFKASFKPEEGEKAETFPVSVMSRNLDPSAIEGGVYKASKQAPVLVTLGKDAINMARAYSGMAQEYENKGETFYGGHIFDGILIPTTQAADMARALNKEFKRLNTGDSDLVRYLNQLKAQAVEKGIRFDIDGDEVAASIYNQKTNKEDQKVRLSKLIQIINKRYKDLQRDIVKADVDQFSL